MKVCDLMSEEVLSVTPDMGLREAAALLVQRGISGVPVVDAGGAVVGVLSETDVVLKASGTVSREGLLGWLLEPDADRDKIAAVTVGDAMSAPAVTIAPTRPIHEAARLMLRESVNRLPVVDAGKLVGILTRADVVRAFARSDLEIAEEIRGEILRRTFWLEPGRIELSVSDGHVTLTGQVETDADAEMLPLFVSRVPGVVSVHADLSVKTPAGAR